MQVFDKLYEGSILVALVGKVHTMQCNIATGVQESAIDTDL